MPDETWRRKTYYGPRVLIETSDVITAPDTCDLYPLSASHLMLLRNLLAYATRRSTFVSEYGPQSYLAPTTEEWNVLQEIVAELENILMSGCCEDLVTALDAITAQLAANGAVLGSLETAVTTIAGDIPDAVTALQCICTRALEVKLNVTISPDWPEYPDTTDYFDWGTTLPSTTLPSYVDVEACELAQAWYQAGFEWITEVFLPTLRFGFDKVLPAAAAALALWTGGLSIPVAMGVYAVAELIQELMELAYDAAESNLENWLFVHKQDIVCPLYIALKDGGTSEGIWAPIQADLVDPSGDLSAGDKLLVLVAFGVVAPAAAKVAKGAMSPWYLSVPEEGFCDPCEEEPHEWEWNIPPCPPPGWSGVTCWNSRLCLNKDIWSNEEVTLPAPDVGVWNRVYYDVEFTSDRTGGGSVGTIQCFWWDGDSWEDISGTHWLVPSAPIGEENYLDVNSPMLTGGSGGQVLVHLVGWPFQGETEPYPAMVRKIHITFAQV